MNVDIRKFATVLVCGASAPAVALMVAAAAAAEPGAPAVPPAPAAPGPVAGPAPGPAVEVDANGVAAPLPAADGSPHLASPDALPPGSTMDPTMRGNESPNLNYLKDLWHAVQNQEISGKQALLLGVAQRGMNTPVPSGAPGPNVPIRPGSAPEGAPLPADAAPNAPISPDASALPPAPQAVPNLPAPNLPAPPAPLP